ncbi:MAG: aldo/keto reductase [Verrucomicrobia bacterium]|nr:aldo/keto reductase [Verrucomicrobiota bacterium]
MQQFTRREFIRQAAAGSALLAGASVFTGCQTGRRQVRSFNGDARVSLGRTGIKVSRLAQGTGFNGSARQSDHTRMGYEAFERLLRHGMQNGVTFIDMADLYGTHPFVRRAVKDLPRDKYVLLTKIWVRKEDWVTPTGGARGEVERFRKELDADTLDIVLIHCTTDDKWTEQYARVRDELSECREKGLVRAVGVSCHDFGALKVAATHPWVEVIFARINHRGGQEYIMDGPVDEVSDVLRLARRNGKAVVGMKIFGAGKLITPDDKDASLNYVFQNELVDAITVGMRKIEEVDDTLERMSRVKLA